MTSAEPTQSRTARALAELVGGRLEGDGDLVLQRLAPLERAGPDALTFLLAPKYLAAYRATRAGAALVSAALSEESGGPATRIVVPDIDRALARLADLFVPPVAGPEGIDPTARVGLEVELGAGVFVGPFVQIGDGVRIGPRSRIDASAWVGTQVVIGADCLIGPHAVCYPGAQLGDRVLLKAGAVVGGPGFGYVRGADGHRRLPHLGRCVIGDDVEIGSGSCVDRGSFEDTIVGRGTKIDNLVQIGHNVHLGERCLVMATTGIAGSCRVGNDVVIAGGVGIADHVEIGAGAVIGAKSVIFGPGRVGAGAVVSGYPARPHRAFLRAQAALYRLAPLVDDLAALAEERRTGAPADDRTRG